jgi:hypothetical protein
MMATGIFHELQGAVQGDTLVCTTMLHSYVRGVGL